MGPTVLFTHLKIIPLQYFQFSVFNFSNNKLNSNGPKVKERSHLAEFFLLFLAWKETSNGICYIAGHSTVSTCFFSRYGTHSNLNQLFLLIQS